MHLALFCARMLWLTVVVVVAPAAVALQSAARSIGQTTQATRTTTSMELELKLDSLSCWRPHSVPGPANYALTLKICRL